MADWKKIYDPCMNAKKAQAELPPYDQALARILKCTAHTAAESVGLKGALGQALAEPVIADRDQPPFNRATMDGFAISATIYKAGDWFRIIGQLHAGQGEVGQLNAEAGVVRIATGAAVPSGFDAVVPIEDAKVDTDHARVRFSRQHVEPDLFVHAQGADAKAEDELISRCTQLAAHHLGLAAAAGMNTLAVHKRPRVGILTTGDEVVSANTPTSQLQPQQIRNANLHMLNALVSAAGGEVVAAHHAPDDDVAINDLANKLMENCDVIITAGGVSVGERDLLPNLWSGLGYVPIVHGVLIKPGKPLYAAQPADGEGALVLGLPGNPVSVLVTFHLFAWPIMRKMTRLGEDGYAQQLPWRRVWSCDQITCDNQRELFRAARFVGETRDQVEVLPWHGSGDLAHLSQADGLVRLPFTSDIIPAGSALPFLPLLGLTV